MDEAAVVPTRRKLNVDEYYRMADAGILGEDDRVELIDGELIDMAPIGMDHAATVNGLNHALVMACSGKAIVSVQNPVRLDRFNEPQPDFAVSRLRADNYRLHGHPGPADVLLLVEVADSSLRFDKKVKLPLYARAGIGEVWIVNLAQRVLEAYREPAGEDYKSVKQYGAGDRIALGLAPDIVVPLAQAFD